MLYVLDHYYAMDHADYCLIIESDKTVNEIVEICSAIAFLLEDLVDDSACLNIDCLLHILVTYYGAKNRKSDVPGRILSDLGLPIDGVFENSLLPIDNSLICEAYIIDLYEARDSCCGPQYKDILDKWLPKGEQLDELKELLRTTGVDEWSE